MGKSSSRTVLAAVLLTTSLALAGCDESGEFVLKNAFDFGETSVEPSVEGVQTRTEEREIEAPDIFSASEDGLWDGRPSLGGVWVAHPDVKEPERVIIRNTANGKFVVGALFRRERDIPGPQLQISSDAASALDMLAGAPASLNVTALRREQVEVDVPLVDEIPAAPEIETASLDPIAAATAALEATAPSTAATAPTPQQPEAARSNLSKPFVQVGIFSVEGNANRTANQMRSAGMIPTVVQGETAGKPFWRVIVGPSRNQNGRMALLEKIRAEGFTDAYPVTN